MASIRGNSTIQASSSPTPSATLNMTSNALSVYLRNSTQEINPAFNEPDIPKPNSNTINLICALIICCSLGVFIAQFLEKKGLVQKLKLMLVKLMPVVWIKNKYVEMNRNEVLPMYRSKKAKESPFISAMQMPQILPLCPRLEGAEKGQNNLQVRFSIPYRRFQSSENLPAETDHRITITTTVEQTPQATKI